MKSTTFIFILCFALFSCSHQAGEVQEIDIKSYLTPPKLPIKAGDMDTQLHLLFKNIYKNTLNKRIPNLPVTTILGDTIMIHDILNQKSILIFSDNYCSYGMEGMRNDFPKAIEKVNKAYSDKKIHVIGILIKAVEADDDMKRFYKAANEIKPFYSNFYIIDHETAARLNIFGNPTRYYINNEKTITHLGIGINMKKDYLFHEIIDYHILNKEMKKLRTPSDQK